MKAKRRATERFSYRLEPLPGGWTVSLSQAVAFALYGGIPAFRYKGEALRMLVLECEAVQELIKKGKVRGEATEELIQKLLDQSIWQVGDRGRHFLDIEDDKLGISARLAGPAPWRAARRGSLLFGAKDFKKQEERYLEFERAFCQAAHAKRLTVEGHPVPGAYDTAPAIAGLANEIIRNEYFAEWEGADGQPRWRDLFQDSNRINAVHAEDFTPGMALNASDHWSYVNVRVNRAEYLTFLSDLFNDPLARPKPRGRGPLPQYELDLIEPSFRAEVERRGQPHSKNDDLEWRTQADVSRWIQNLFIDRNVDEPSWSTAKRYARLLMSAQGPKPDLS